MRILIAEDEPVSRRRLELMLKRCGYEVLAVADGEAAWQVLKRDSPPRLAVLDWMMPNLDGVSLCRKVRALRTEPYTYIVLLTSRDNEDSLIEGFEAGADDFLSKPFKPRELESRLRTGHRICKLQDDLIQAREALREQATRDVLTECWNRRAVLDALERELRRTWRSPNVIGLGVLIADLDHFKRVNDSHGHPVGDEVLRESVRRITSQIRPYDVVGRLGGEEFLILLTDCGHRQVVNAAERLRSAICNGRFETSAGHLSVTASLGAASIEAGNLVATELAIATADQALYDAKEAGRNRSCCVEILPDGPASRLELPDTAKTGGTAALGTLPPAAEPGPAEPPPGGAGAEATSSSRQRIS